ncbi:MAG: DNA double-strand break repair nuclease NurA [Candidatus Woesearchaeota archaeon]
MDELIRKLKGIKNDSSLGAHILMNKNYSPIIIDENNFHDIELFDEPITFIDGGQAVLFESAGFCLGFIRVAALKYSSNKRIFKDIEEFHVLVLANDGMFSVNTFPKNELDNLKIDPENESLRNGVERASPSKIISVIRRLAELKKANDYVNVILDGTLEARYPHELSYITNLKNASALSKTCSLITNTGDGIVTYLKSMNDNSWYYYPIVQNNNKNHPSEIFFVKLNKNSDYVFRFEHKGEIAKKIIGTLAKNSIDPTFLGYPYGLVDVDQYARISEQEKKMLQTQISVKLGSEWKNFSKNLKSMNAHEILDNIRF